MTEAEAQAKLEKFFLPLLAKSYWLTGAEVRELRLVVDQPATAFAAAAGINRTRYGLYEKGRCQLTNDEQLKLVGALLLALRVIRSRYAIRSR